MRRFLVPLILFVVGALLITLGLLKFLPGAAGGGGGLAFLGVLLFGLSFIRQPEVPADAPSPLSPIQRVTGIFFEPTRVFQNLRCYPRWLIAVLIISLVSVVYSIAFTKRLSAERIAQYTSDKMKDLETRGWMPPGQAEENRLMMIADAKNPIATVGRATNEVVTWITLIALLAGLYLGIVLMFGGRINFWQAFAATAYAALPVTVLEKLLSLVILYVKDPDAIPPILGQNSLVQDNLGVLITAGDHPALWVFATAIGILSLYHLWLIATGLKNAGQKVNSTAAWAPVLIVWILGTLLLAGWVSLFPSFMT